MIVRLAEETRIGHLRLQGFQLGLQLFQLLRQLFQLTLQFIA